MLENTESEPPIIIDVGSAITKIGLAGDITPNKITTVVGLQRARSIFTRDVYVGEQVLQSSLQIINYPIDYNHHITDMNDYKDLVSYAIHNCQKIQPQDRCLLYTCYPLISNRDIQHVAQIVFETFDLAALCFKTPGALSLYATGRTNGISVDCGHGSSVITPIVDGIPIKTSVQHSVGGSDLTNYLSELLQVKHITTVTSIKEKLVSFVERDEYSNFELPDGQIVTIGKERHLCAQALFEPELIGKDVVGVHQAIVKSAEGNEDLLAHIVPIGGTTLIEGLTDELKTRLAQLTSSQLNVVEGHDQNTISWLGGSVFASQSTFYDSCFKSEEYQEHGTRFIEQYY
jgi:actin